MMTFRNTAPETQVITQLDFAHVNPVYTPGGNPVYHSPQRDFGVLRLDLYWPAGTAVQGAPFIARSANTLRLNGTANLTAEQVQEGFEYLGASVGTDTGLMSSSLSLKVRKEAFPDALKWLMKVLDEASFPESEISNYKQVESAGLLRRMQTPRYWSNRRCMEALYGENSADAAFADPGDIQALTQSELAGWASNYLDTSSALLFLSGDAGLAEVDYINQVFNKPFHSASKTTGVVNTTMAPIQHIRHRVEHSNQVSMYWARHTADFSMKELQTASLLNMFLGGFFGSRLMQELREEKGLTYGIGSMILPATRGNTWMISGEMNSANADEAMEATRKIMKGLIDHPPAGDELEKAKRYYAGQLRSGFDGPFSLPRKIQFLLERGYDYSYYDTALTNLWAITTDELGNMADNLLKPESFTIALAGETDKIN